MGAVRVIGDNLIANLLIAIDIRNKWTCNNGDLRFRKTAAYRTQRRQRHDCVAHPVRRANENLHAAAPCRLERTRSMAARNSLSEESTKSITATYTGRLKSRACSRFCSSFSVVMNALAPL